MRWDNRCAGGLFEKSAWRVPEEHLLPRGASSGHCRVAVARGEGTAGQQAEESRAKRWKDARAAMTPSGAEAALPPPTAELLVQKITSVLVARMLLVGVRPLQPNASCWVRSPLSRGLSGGILEYFNTRSRTAF